MTNSESCDIFCITCSILRGGGKLVRITKLFIPCGDSYKNYILLAAKFGFGLRISQNGIASIIEYISLKLQPYKITKLLAMIYSIN